jgi:hypothetical protein
MCHVLRPVMQQSTHRLFCNTVPRETGRDHSLRMHFLHYALLSSPNTTPHPTQERQRDYQVEGEAHLMLWDDANAELKVTEMVNYVFARLDGDLLML